MAAKLNVGEPTLDDIFDALAKPGRDPREDLPPPIFKTGVLQLEDITPGMELKGTVLNVVPFGAFVDIGLKESGLVHISQMANRYIKTPVRRGVGGRRGDGVGDGGEAGREEDFAVDDPAGQERRPPERGERGGRGDAPPREQREPRGDRPRGDRPPPAQERPPQPARDDRGGNRGGFQPRQGQGAGDRGGFQPRQGQGASGRFNRGPAGPGAPPPRPNAAPAGAQPPAQPVQPPSPPKPPGKPKPLPNLTPEKKAGKAALNTFGELLAFFKPPEPEKKPEPPKAEEKQAEEPPKPEEKKDEPKSDSDTPS